MSTENDNLDLNIERSIQFKNTSFTKNSNVITYSSLIESYYGGQSFISYGYNLFNRFFNGFNAVFELKGLPDGLTSVDVLDKLLISGKVGIIKAGSKYFAVGYNIKDYDLYNNATDTTIFEPKFILNGSKGETYDLTEIRLNKQRFGFTALSLPFIKLLDRAYYGVEKNVDMSFGRYLWPEFITFETSEKNKEKAVNEWLLNGDFIKLFNIGDLGTNEVKLFKEQIANLFIKLEFDDRSPTLINSFKFVMNQYLETLGFPTNEQADKKERLISAELSTGNIVQNNLLITWYNNIKKDLEVVNSEFGLNITVEFNELDPLKEIIAEVKDNDEEGGSDE